MARKNEKGDFIAAADRAAVPLPVVNGNRPSGEAAGLKIRASRNGPRRAVVLALVHVLIAAHIIQWVVTGTTTTPIEPAEAMEFSKQGIVNLGLIFFALALLSTLVLGRWFCGWGCHVVALQDLCGWMMKKMGIRPKPFRSRLLIYVPLLLALYMFIWPAFYRWAIAPWLTQPDRLPGWELQAHLTTSDFWATFPGLAVAIPFLLICGFACVYFLGAKGFCTYGCPYGGFFAPLDEYSPARIRVTDACEQCGHCTAVCTSNVRVHEEVREYGMVVDPGCMKCLDCVSVCPNDALYFGFGKPAVAKGKPRKAAPKKKHDMTLGEDIAFALVFAAVFFAFRGDYARFPLLMAAGVAGVLTFIIWKAYRAWRDENSNLYRYQLKLRGVLQPAGIVMIAVAGLVALLVAHSGVVNAANAIGGWHDGNVRVPQHIVYWSNDEVDEATREHAARGIRWMNAAAALAGDDWTPSRQWRSGIDVRRAWLHSVRGEFAQAEIMMRRAIEQPPAIGDRLSANRQERHAPPAQLVRGMGMILAAQPNRVDDALAWYRDALVDIEPPDARPMVEDFVVWADRAGRSAAALSLLEQRLQRHPRDTHTMRWLALHYLDAARFDEGIALLETAIELDPADDAARSLLEAARR